MSENTELETIAEDQLNTTILKLLNVEVGSQINNYWEDETLCMRVDKNNGHDGSNILVQSLVKSNYTNLTNALMYRENNMWKKFEKVEHLNMSFDSDIGEGTVLNSGVTTGGYYAPVIDPVENIWAFGPYGGSAPIRFLRRNAANEFSIVSAPEYTGEFHANFDPVNRLFWFAGKENNGMRFFRINSGGTVSELTTPITTEKCNRSTFDPANQVWGLGTDSQGIKFFQLKNNEIVEIASGVSTGYYNAPAFDRINSIWGFSGDHTGLKFFKWNSNGTLTPVSSAISTGTYPHLAFDEKNSVFGFASHQSDNLRLMKFNSTEMKDLNPYDYYEQNKGYEGVSFYPEMNLWLFYGSTAKWKQYKNGVIENITGPNVRDTVLYDEKNKTWFYGTSESGYTVCRYNNGTIVIDKNTPKFQNQLALDQVNSILVEYSATKDVGLKFWKIEGKTFTPIPCSLITGKYIDPVFDSHNQIVWIATNSGTGYKMLKHRSDGMVEFTTTPSTGSFRAENVGLDINNSIWAISETAWEELRTGIKLIHFDSTEIIIKLTTKLGSTFVKNSVKIKAQLLKPTA